MHPFLQRRRLTATAAPERRDLRPAKRKVYRPLDERESGNPQQLPHVTVAAVWVLKLASVWAPTGTGAGALSAVGAESLKSQLCDEMSANKAYSPHDEIKNDIKCDRSSQRDGITHQAAGVSGVAEGVASKKGRGGVPYPYG